MHTDPDFKEPHLPAVSAEVGHTVRIVRTEDNILHPTVPVRVIVEGGQAWTTTMSVFRATEANILAFWDAFPSQFTRQADYLPEPPTQAA